MPAFNRKYKLTLGAVGSTDTIIIENQHIEFSISQTSDSESNSIEIRVYNLARRTVNLLDKKDLPIKLEAGYSETGIGLIFSGRKTRVHTWRSGTEIITSILASDGAKEKREARCSTSLPKGVSLRNIIENVIDRGFPNYSKTLKGEILDNKFYNSGWSYSGPVSCALDTLCNSNGLEWNILNNSTINVFPKNNSFRSQSEFVVLSPSSGLIGTPEKFTKEQNTLEGDKTATEEVGVRVASLLNHKIVAGTFLLLQDTGVFVNSPNKKTSIDGKYKIERVSHTGSFEGDDWTTSAECVIVR